MQSYGSMKVLASPLQVLPVTYKRNKNRTKDDYHKIFNKAKTNKFVLEDKRKFEQSPYLFLKCRVLVSMEKLSK